MQISPKYLIKQVHQAIWDEYSFYNKKYKSNFEIVEDDDLPF